MAQAHGARAQMALVFEKSYGASPASGYVRVPFVSTGLSAEQPLQTSDLLGYGRDPQAPVEGALTVDGDVVVPVDAEAFGFWLTAAFGKAKTTGSAKPWTHEFQSGKWDLPSLSIETAMPEVPHFAIYSGCMIDKLDLKMEYDGLLTATVSLIAQDEVIAAKTAAGSPAIINVRRFCHFNGALHLDGKPIGRVVSADVSYANNLERIETVGGGGRISGADPSVAALTGSIEVRFADQTLLQQAIDGKPCKLDFGWTLPTSESLTWTAHAVYLPRPRREIQGPQEVQASFDWQAASDMTTGRMCTVVLKNNRETY